MKSIYRWIDSLWVWIAERIFIRFEFDLPLERLRKSGPSNRIIFALTHVGIIEFLILSSWCRSNGLGTIVVANRRRILFLSSPKLFFKFIFGRTDYAQLFLSDIPGPRLLFCPPSERKKLFQPIPVESLLGEVYGAIKANSALHFNFVPVFVLWRKHVRGASRRLFEYLVGLGSSPNLLGKVWYLARARRDSVVRALADFSSDSFSPHAPETTDALGESEAMWFAKATRRKILVLVHQEMRVVLGPRYLAPPAVKETLLRDPDIQRMIAEVSQNEKMDRKKGMSLAYGYFSEIVANYQYRTIEISYVLLTWFFTKVFDGVSVHEEELHAVREIMKTKPVVFVSCHRSHLDYLVIPYVLFSHDIVTPHIAAGINLSFWPIGSFLRSGGAFFIRRSFRGNVLYSTCLRKYIEYLLKNRYNLKFFIEGTRSRSGKMLAPAYGMLKMVMEVQRDKGLDEVALIPVSICYDEVPEQSSYSKELGGGQKVKESAKELLKSREIIKKNIGKVYVRFGQAISVREVQALAEQQHQDSVLTLQKTAFQICKEINDISPITAKSIVSSVLLGSSHSFLSLEEILRLSALLITYVDNAQYPLSLRPVSQFRHAAEQIVRRLQKSNVLTLSANQIPRTYTLDKKKRNVLNFYKNNAIHAFVRPAILFIALFRALEELEPTDSAEQLKEKLWATCLDLRNLLKFDFFFSPSQIFLQELQKDLKFFFDTAEWSQLTVDQVVTQAFSHFRTLEDAGLFARMLGELLDSYHTALRFIESSDSAPLEKKAFVQKIIKFAENLNSQGALAFPESISIQNYSNALQLMENLKLVTVNAEGEKKLVEITGAKDEIVRAKNHFAKYLECLRKEIYGNITQRGYQFSAKPVLNLPDPTATSLTTSPS